MSGTENMPTKDQKEAALEQLPKQLQDLVQGTKGIVFNVIVGMDKKSGEKLGREGIAALIDSVLYQPIDGGYEAVIYENPRDLHAAIKSAVIEAGMKESSLGNTAYLLKDGAIKPEYAPSVRYVELLYGDTIVENPLALRTNAQAIEQLSMSEEDRNAAQYLQTEVAALGMLKDVMNGLTQDVVDINNKIKNSGREEGAQEALLLEKDSAIDKIEYFRNGAVPILKELCGTVRDPKYYDDVGALKEAFIATVKEKNITKIVSELDEEGHNYDKVTMHVLDHKKPPLTEYEKVAKESNANKELDSFKELYKTPEDDLQVTFTGFLSREEELDFSFLFKEDGEFKYTMNVEKAANISQDLDVNEILKARHSSRKYEIDPKLIDNRQPYRSELKDNGHSGVIDPEVLKGIEKLDMPGSEISSNSIALSDSKAVDNQLSSTEKNSLS